MIDSSRVQTVPRDSQASLIGFLRTLLHHNGELCRLVLVGEVVRFSVHDAADDIPDVAAGRAFDTLPGDIAPQGEPLPAFAAHQSDPHRASHSLQLAHRTTQYRGWDSIWAGPQFGQSGIPRGRYKPLIWPSPHQILHSVRYPQGHIDPSAPDNRGTQRGRPAARGRSWTRKSVLPSRVDERRLWPQAWKATDSSPRSCCISRTPRGVSKPRA